MYILTAVKINVDESVSALTFLTGFYSLSGVYAQAGYLVTIEKA